MRSRMRKNETSTEERDMRTEGTGRAPRRGFGGYNKVADGLNRTTFQVKDDPEVIAFLEPENFTYALRHWVKFFDDSNQQQTRAEWCLEEDCPICDIGDTPKAVCFFNVVDIANPGKVLVWEASADPTGAIQKEFTKLSRRGQFISDEQFYWVISKAKGKNGFYTYSVDRLHIDDMAVEWPKLSPLTPEQRTALRGKLYDEDYVEYKDREELQAFVDTLG
jgi:hypothetical protein